MPRHRQLSIEEQGGIAAYLDKTAEDHSGIGWDLFDLFCERRVQNAVIGRIMGRDKDHPITGATIRDWKRRRLERSDT